MQLQLFVNNSQNNIYHGLFSMSHYPVRWVTAMRRGFVCSPLMNIQHITLCTSAVN